MKTKKKCSIFKFLFVVAMVFSIFVIKPFTANAAINAVWWTSSSDQSDFTVNFDSDYVGSSAWYRLKIYDEVNEKYIQVEGDSGCGYVGSQSSLDFEQAIRNNGTGTYMVSIELTSGTVYETSPKTYTFTGSLDKATNLYWNEDTVHWNAVEGADKYYVLLYFRAKDSANYITWSSGIITDGRTFADFSGELINEGIYYFTVEASSTDEMLVSSTATSEDKIVEYTRSDLNAHFGSVSSNQRKYTLYWEKCENATGYYLLLSKKDGDEYLAIGGVGGKLSSCTYYDLYDIMEANGEGDYKAEIFAFNTSPTVVVSNESSVEITFTECEHSYTKEIQEKYYGYEIKKCPEKSKYYYACEYCNEKAPESEEYIYEGDVNHALSNNYACDATHHWLECTSCDYKVINNHYLDEYNYCYVCKTTIYNIWLGDILITSKNCDDILGDGKCFYMPDKNILVIDSYYLDGSVREGVTVINPENGLDYVAMIYAEDSLNLHIRGDNKLYEDAGDIGRQYCVYVENGDLTVTGTGSLYTNTSTGFYTANGDIYLNLTGSLDMFVGVNAFNCDDLYINNGTIKVRSYSDFVYTSVPVLDDYSTYFAEVSDSHDMTDLRPFNEDEIEVKYFYIEPAMKVTMMPLECLGTAMTELVRKGEVYTLPECPYAAPSGKTFYKWGVDPQGLMYNAGDTITITADTTLYPTWKAITIASISASYSDDIVAGNKINPEKISITATYTDSSTQPVSPADVEYWYNGSKIEDPINYVFNAELIGELSIVVKYEGFETTMTVNVVGYNVSFNANGGTGEMAGAEYVGTYTLPACEFTAPNDKQFKGWSISTDGEIIESTYDVASDIEFYAIWEDIPVVKYDVIFNANGGTGDMAGVEYAGTYTLPTCEFTAPDGKQFKGWSTSADGEIIESTYDVASDIEFYAIWEDIPVVKYDVIFNANGGTGDMAGVEYAGTYTLPTCEFTAPDGKQFKGWSTSVDGEIIESTYDVVSDIEFYALWENIPHTHDFGDTWKSDEDNHYKECACGEKSAEEAHVDSNNDGKCDVCDHEMPTQSSTPTDPTNPTESKKGLSTGAVVAIVISSVLVVSIAGFAIFWFAIKKKNFQDLVKVFKKNK